MFVFIALILAIAIATAIGQQAINSTAISSTINPIGLTGLAFYLQPFNNGDSSNDILVSDAGVEVVFGTNQGSKPVKIAGAKTAIHVSPLDVTTANVISWLSEYDYVHITEISPAQPTCPQEDCALVAERVAAKGFSGRIIFSIRYSYDGTNMNQLTSLFEAAKAGYLRKIFFAAYGDNFLYTSNMNTAMYHELTDWAINFNKVVESINVFLAPTIGLRNGNYSNPYLDDPYWDFTFLQSVATNIPDITWAWRGVAFAAADQTMGTEYYTQEELIKECRVVYVPWRLHGEKRTSLKKTSTMIENLSSADQKQ